MSKPQQLSLFDDGEPPVNGAQTSSNRVAGPEETREEPGKSPSQQYVAWTEVPAELFLFWSDARQLDYCARRDEHASRYAATPEKAAWYGARGEGYRSDLKELLRAH